MASTKNTPILEATAAVAASLVALISSYPIDVIKTNLQTERNDDGETGGKDGAEIQASASASAMRVLSDLFRGMHLKIAQTSVQSFSYFYIYSSVKSTHRRIQAKSSQKKYQPSVVAQLLLAAISAAITVTLTLPMETIATRGQMKSSNDDDKSTTTELTESTYGDTVGSCGNALEDDDSDSDESSVVTVGSSNKSKNQTLFHIDSDDSSIMTLNNEERKTRQEIQMGSLNLLKSSPNHRTKLQDIAMLWSGLGPSLLLTSNPAINFTVFDTLKSAILKRKAKKSLGFFEAFVVGIVAKFASTIMTYPLIRTKMILMCARRNNEMQQRPSLVDDSENDSMASVLRSMYDKGGVKEMYKGCGLTLLLTLFRASVFMMSRDKITEKIVGC